MLKFFLLCSFGFLLSACSTAEKFEKRASDERSREAGIASQAVEKAPKWMEKLPESKNAVFANGSGISRDFSMADEKAKLIAFGQLCTSAGGEIDKQTLIFLSDTESVSSERSELAIRSLCRGVDIAGVEVVEIKRIVEGSRFRSYVLVALPIETANLLGARNERRKSFEDSKRRSEQAVRELEENRRR
jgi:hypothetical protein